MDDALCAKFEELVLQGLTITGIRNQLGASLDSFTDAELVKQMLAILN